MDALTGHGTPASPEVQDKNEPVSVAAPSSIPIKSSFSDKERERLLYPGRVNLTSASLFFPCFLFFTSCPSAYPDQHGIKPYRLNWGAVTPTERGPVVCSRLQSSLKQRNALGAHSGSYSIYRALSIAMGSLSPTHKPDYTMTEPPVDFPPQPSWSDPEKIVAFDPWGHLVQTVFKAEMDAGIDIRPSIAVTKAHLKMSELDEAARNGTINIDEEFVLRSRPVKNQDGTESIGNSGVEVNVSKAAVEPVWYLPGVAERFGMSV